jgi:diguanylate cyclase (GGDEF)-like protein/PAS domain S-box-containing protein
MLYSIKNPASRLAAVLVACIFIGELVIMFAFEKFIHVSNMVENFLDPTLLTIFCTPPIYYLVFLPMIKRIAQQEKIESQLRIAAAAFQTHDAIMITDANSNIIRVNKAFETITGYKEDEVIGKKPSILHSGRHDASFYKKLWAELIAKGIWSGEIWDSSKNGIIYPKQTTISAVKNDLGETVQYVAVFTNIAERKKAEEEIYNLAFMDSLTGLPNRRLLQDRVNVALTASGRTRMYGALLFIDLDNFKTINDKFGREMGDKLLTQVADRLKFSLRESDTVARLSGDEFVVMLENLSLEDNDAWQKASHIAEKIREIITQPYELDRNLSYTSPSIGVCIFLDHNQTVDELFKHADMAMYQAKVAGKNGVRFFDPNMQNAIESRAALESDLRLAVKNDQLKLYYQIQLDHEKRAIGAEALVRWLHPKHGMVSPANFIPIAEESSLIVEMGDWVLNQACKQIAKWSKNEQTKDLVLAINISSRQFMQPDFVEQVEHQILKNGIEASRLKLELTESVALDDLELVVKKMLLLRHVVGVSLSLDDFGTGYSSLSYLKRLPLDQIKIDQSFVRNMTIDDSDAMMVKNIIDMAHNFGFNVIAEGVETVEQLELLKKNGCLSYQGYLFSKPIPIEQFELLLIENSSTLTI